MNMRFFQSDESPESKADSIADGLKQAADYQKAKSHFELAKKIAEASPENWSKICEELLAAIYLKLDAAGDYLVAIVFHKARKGEDLNLPTLLQKLEDMSKLNSVALFCLGKIFTGDLHFTGNDEMVLPMLPQAKTIFRSQHAIDYLEMATAQGNDKAQNFLAHALATGQSGCIKQNFERAYRFSLNLAKKGNQVACLRLGLYFQRQSDSDQSFNYLTMATRGANWNVAQDALKNIINKLKKDSFNKLDFIEQRFEQEAKLGNPNVALYLAYCYCPKELLPHLGNSIFSTLPEPLKIKEPSLEKAAYFLALASSIRNPKIQAEVNQFCDLLTSFQQQANRNE